MAEIVNLRRVKKAKARRAAGEKAAANRAHFGAPKAERKRADSLRKKEASAIEGHKLEDKNG